MDDFFSRFGSHSRLLLLQPATWAGLCMQHTLPSAGGGDVASSLTLQQFLALLRFAKRRRPGVCYCLNCWHVVGRVVSVLCASLAVRYCTALAWDSK